MTLSDGRKIYHAYKDQEIQLSYWYQTDETEDPKYEFDVRELSTYYEDEPHEVVIQNAVTFGEIEFPE